MRALEEERRRLEERRRQLEEQYQERVRQLEHKQSATKVPMKAARGDYRPKEHVGTWAIAKALGTTPEQVRALHAKHGLPAHKVGKALVADADELDRWAARWRAGLARLGP